MFLKFHTSLFDQNTLHLQIVKEPARKKRVIKCLKLKDLVR